MVFPQERERRMVQKEVMAMAKGFVYIEKEYDGKFAVYTFESKYTNSSWASAQRLTRREAEIILRAFVRIGYKIVSR